MNNNLILFFDGCHKIYYAERDDQEIINQMTGYGYKVYDDNFSKDLANIWREAGACGLRFIHHADCDMSKPQVSQFQVGGLRGFRTKLANYYKEHAA